MNKRLIFLLIIFLSIVGRIRSQDLSFILTTDSVVYDTVLFGAKYSHADLHNISLVNTVTVDIVRVQNDLFGTWVTGMCTNICYSIFIDTIAVVLSPGQIQELKMGFRIMAHNSYTAHTKLTITNRSDISNKFVQNYYGIDSTSLLMTSISENKINDVVTVSPNPYSSETTLQLKQKLNSATLSIYNSVGQCVKQIQNISGDNIKLSRDNLATGIYFIQMKQDNTTVTTKLMVAD